MEVYFSAGRGSLCTCNEHVQTEKGTVYIMFMITFILPLYVQHGYEKQRQVQRKILMYGQAILLRHQGTKKVSPHTFVL